MKKTTLYNMTYDHFLIPEVLEYIKNNYPDCDVMWRIIDYMDKHREASYKDAVCTFTPIGYYLRYTYVMYTGWKKYITEYNKEKRIKHE